MNLTGYFKGKNNAWETEHGTDPSYYISETTINSGGSRISRARWATIPNLYLIWLILPENGMKMRQGSASISPHPPPLNLPVHWAWQKVERKKTPSGTVSLRRFYQSRYTTLLVIHSCSKFETSGVVIDTIIFLGNWYTYLVFLGNIIKLSMFLAKLFIQALLTQMRFCR